MSSFVGILVFVSILVTLLAVYSPSYTGIPASWQSYICSSNTASPSVEDACESHRYTTEVISTDPLMIYINDFVHPDLAESLLELGEPHFKKSEVFLHGRKVPSSQRTSQSAGIPPSDPSTSCILSRARRFMGSTLSPDGDFGTPQLVRYEAGQKFDLHYDWYDTPQRLPDGRRFNRVASFFVFLQDECTEGETWFPHIEENIVSGEERTKGKMRIHENGGMAFRPMKGNALFWLNLHRNGTGDHRVRHAGLPLGEGTKTAMNLWARKFYQ